MKVCLVALYSLLIGLIFGSCSTSRYAPAEKLILQNEYNKAVRTYLELLAPHSKGGKRFIYYDPEAIAGIGVVYCQMEKYETAERILQMVINKDPVFGKALFYLGLAFEGQGKIDNAITIYKKFYHVNANDPYRQMMMGRLDFLTRMEITRKLQYNLQHESEIDIATFPEKSIAVLYFTNLTNDKQWDPIQKGLAEILITDLSQIEGFNVIDRISLNAMMEELKMDPNTYMDENTLFRVGKLFGTQKLIKGSYSISSNLKMVINSNVFNMSGINALDSTAIEGNLSSIFQMEKEMVLKILDSFGIQLTLKQRESLLKIPTDNIDAFLFYCQGLDAIDRFQFDEAQGFFRNALMLDRNFEVAQDWLMPPKVWDFTHNRNVRRVGFEVATILSRIPKGEPLVYKPQPAMLSTTNRLRAMGLKQNAAFIPGKDSRKPFWEAVNGGASFVPRKLAMPPALPE